MTDIKVEELILPLKLNIKQERLSPVKPEPDSAIKIENDITTANIPNSLPEVQKSSSEILTELFGVFNVEPPVISSDPPKREKRLSDSSKHKKSKKKHKHKDKKKKKKKLKKRGRSDSDGSSSSNESVEHNKKHKRSKLGREKAKPDNGYEVIKKEDIQDSNETAHDIRERLVKWKLEKGLCVEIPNVREGNERHITNSPKESLEQTASNSNNTSELPQVPVSPKLSLLESDASTQPKPSGTKIMIKSLKFSTVFKANVKQAEEDAKKKALLFEDGELSDSSFTPDEESITENDLKNMDIDESLPCIKEQESKTRDSVSHSKHRRKSKDKEKDSAHSETRSHSHKDKNKSRSNSRSRSDRKHNERHNSPVRSRKRSSDRKDEVRSHKRIRDHRSDYNSRSQRRRSYSRPRSRDREGSSARSTIDKKRLLEIARKNAIHMLKSGTLPGAAGLGPQAQEKVLAAIKAGGKSIEELTDFCKNLSQKEELGELSSFSSESDNDEATEKPFHHPFIIKDRGAIVMNIRNSVPLPTRTLQEKTMEQSKALKMLFPVSSGQHHCKTESEWVPVSPPRPAAVVPALKQKTAPLPLMPPPPAPVQPVLTVQNIQPPLPTDPPLAPALIQNKVFIDNSNTSYNISDLVTQRLQAIRKLQENPTDVCAMQDMYQAQEEVKAWAESKYVPGQFTGSTGANILTVKELAAGTQAWAKRDQLQNAAPVTGGMGMHLLKKMGWNPGEGLGKDKSGSLQPLMLEVKLDKRGLVSNEEAPFRNRPNKNSVQTVKTLIGKHPVSLLGEFSSKRKLGVPSYELCFECGPDHKKNFLFKVKLNGVEYQPSVASANKKQAKADAATVCLQQLGVLPTT